MTTLQTAAQQALEALELYVPKEDYENRPVGNVIDALRAALAEPVQEPVAWLRVIDEAMVTHHLGVADPTDDYETAKRKMNTLLSAAQDIGTYFAKQAGPQEPVQEALHPSRLALFARACQHPVVLEIMADCADCVDTENSAQHDSDEGPYDGEKWAALAIELRQQAAEIRAEDPEIWPKLVHAPQPPAEPVPEPDDPQRRCGGPGCDMTCCQPVQEPVAQRGAMFCTHPAVERQRSVEAAVRPACGVDPAAKAQPVQEPKPVAWRFEARHIDSAWAAAVTLKHPGPEGIYMRNVMPLYAHPPQRLPLTDEEIERLWYPSAVIAEPGKRRVAFGRAVERAHGITP